jgi:hypothetical protein
MRGSMERGRSQSIAGGKRSAVPEADDSYLKKKCMRVCARPNVLHVAL